MKLSVLLVTYNHSKFIDETLKSVLMQKTNFDYNIVIADDNSKDDTLEKIMQMQSQTGIEFVYLDSSVNHGITKNYKRGFAACNSEYVAVMEGDDLWTNPYRLQKHVDFLENHRECTMSFNRYIVGDFEKSKFHMQPFWIPENNFQLITARDLCKDNIIGNFSNCVYRKAELDKLPEKMFDLVCYDWLTNIMVGKNGMIAYLSENMNIYRIHLNGTWSSKSQEENLKSIIKSIEDYNEFTEGLFYDEFMEHKGRLEALLAVQPIHNIVVKSKFSDIKRKLKKIKDWMPPFIIWIIKGIIPRRISNKLF